MKPKKPKSEEEEKPWLVFRLCKDKCLACAGCGYVWGPARSEELVGQPAVDSNGRPY